MNRVKIFSVKRIWHGKASGPALVSKERLSFYGYTDPKRGVFKGPTIELREASFAGAVLIFISGKGASAEPRILDLACRFGNAPAAIINLEIEPIMVQGCVFQNIPLVKVDDLSIFKNVTNANIVSVDADRGKVIIN